MIKDDLSKRALFKIIFETEALFTNHLARALHLERVKGPLFVDPQTGINDTLSGTEKPVTFKYKNQTFEIVQSLAKWKRQALHELGFKPYEGIYVHMHAIRPDETEFGKYHDLHVDQYDWEKVILPKDRNLDFLINQAELIYNALKLSKAELLAKYDFLKYPLPSKLNVFNTYELAEMAPTLTPEEREAMITKKYQAVLIVQIGHKLSKNDEPHAHRAHDYDDWMLNGDLIMWDHIHQAPIELSSMGIRVDRETLISQADLVGATLNSDFHKKLLNQELPASIGGGIGRSRVNLFLLEQDHIIKVK